MKAITQVFVLRNQCIRKTYSIARPMVNALMLCSWQVALRCPVIVCCLYSQSSGLLPSSLTCISISPNLRASPQLPYFGKNCLHSGLNPKLRIVSSTPPSVVDPRGVTVPDSSQGPDRSVSHHSQRRDLANEPVRLPPVTRTERLLCSLRRAAAVTARPDRRPARLGEASLR